MFHQSRFPKKLVTIIIILVLMTYVPFKIVERNLSSTILSIARTYAEQIAVTTISNAVNERVAQSVEYKDLIFIRTDNNGRIVLMQANTVKINNLAAETTLDIQETLAKLEGRVIPIPLGQALRSQLLAAYGPKIKVTLIPFGTVKVKVLDDFQQAGINQTRHRLSLNITGQVKIVIPMASETIEVSTQVPVAETVIVGEVPHTYLNLDMSKGIASKLIE